MTENLALSRTVELAALCSVEPQLDLCFAAAGGKTHLARQHVRHPYHVGRTLHRPGDPAGMATVYVQGCAGGMFEHDRLHERVAVSRGALAHVTTAAATIVHRMPHGGHADLTVSLRVEGGALLEYFPDPLILFPESRVRARVHVELAAAARAIVSESFFTHRLPDHDGVFDWLDCATEIHSASRLLARDRYLASGRAFLDGSIELSGAHVCYGGLLVLGAEERPLSGLRRAIEGVPDSFAGVSVLPGRAGVIARVLARDAVALRRVLELARRAAREALGEPAGTSRPK